MQKIEKRYGYQPQKVEKYVKKIKTIRDAAHGINLSEQRSKGRNAHDGLRGGSGLQKNGGIGRSGEPDRNGSLRQDGSGENSKGF